VEFVPRLVLLLKRDHRDPSRTSASLATPTLLVTSHSSSSSILTNSASLTLSQSSDSSSTTFVVDFPSTARASSSSLPSLIPSTSSSTPHLTFLTPSIIPSSIASPFPVSSSQGATDFALVPSTSSAVPTTFTTVVSTVASPSSTPVRSSSSSFFQDKAKSGAVLGVASLAALAGLAFIAYRLYKAVMERRADRETEDAARDAANLKVRLPDDDYDDVYGSRSTGKGRGMMQFFNRTSMIPLEFSTSRGLESGVFDGKRRSSDGINPFLDTRAGAYNGDLPLYHQPTQPGGAPPYVPPPFDSVGRTTPQPRSSTESTDNLIPKSRSGSTVPSEVGSLTVPPQPPAPQQAPYPTLPLPAVFGEGEPPGRRNPALTKSLGDNEDYSGAIRRVLKVRRRSVRFMLTSWVN
jgi:hypothetical protein